jgi:serine/threonine-protein kinase
VVSFRGDAIAAGAQIGDYVLRAEVGEGATGTVFHAQTSDGVDVAVKILKRALLRDETYRARFRREARVATEVQHPNLVRVVDFGDDEGAAYIVSEYRDGGSLADAITRDGRLPLTEAVRVAGDIGAGLEALHEHGVVHRDVKPSNVLLDRAGNAALTDFGLARGEGHTVVTKTGAVLGTLDYLAPELIEGKAATPASDIYAFGCLMYECITGDAPFAECSLFELAVAHLEEEPPDPRERRDGIPNELAWALQRPLKKDPARRPPTPLAYARLLATSLS